jgi:hypothetical protein
MSRGATASRRLAGIAALVCSYAAALLQDSTSSNDTVAIVGGFSAMALLAETAERAGASSVLVQTADFIPLLRANLLFLFVVAICSLCAIALRALVG